MEDFECSTFMSEEELEWIEENGVCWDCTDCAVPYRASRIEQGVGKGGSAIRQDSECQGQRTLQ